MFSLWIGEILSLYDNKPKRLRPLGLQLIVVLHCLELQETDLGPLQPWLFTFPPINLTLSKIFKKSTEGYNLFEIKSKFLEIIKKKRRIVEGSKLEELTSCVYYDGLSALKQYSKKNNKITKNCLITVLCNIHDTKYYP